MEATATENIVWTERFTARQACVKWARLEVLRTTIKASTESARKIKRWERTLIETEKFHRTSEPCLVYDEEAHKRWAYAAWTKHDWLRQNRRVYMRCRARNELLAYAYLRGMPYKRVEPKVREGNEPRAEDILFCLPPRYPIAGLAQMSGRYHSAIHLKAVKAWLEVPLPEPGD